MHGQVSTEFFMYVIIFMMVVIAAFIMINYMQNTEIPAQQNRIARFTGEEFANVITLAVKGGVGFTYNYTFPRTVMGMPYSITFEPNEANVIIMEWNGAYGNFSYSYNIPAYGYEYDGCVFDKKLVSNQCSNVLTLSNDGRKLKITQEE